MGSVDARPPEGSTGAVFETDVRIRILGGQEIKLCDIIADISNETNILDVKCSLSGAISCSMYIIRLLFGLKELPNAISLSRIGHQGDSLNLTMVQSPYCDASGMELLMCLRCRDAQTDELDQLLWKHADPNATDVDGLWPVTTLSLAIRRDHVEAARLLCNAGANKNQANRYGVTPLTEACREGQHEVVRFLCDAGVNKNEAEAQGQTPLFIASSLGHVAVVQVLCRAGANTNQATAAGFTPLQVASDLMVACLLRNAGAERTSRSGVKRRRGVECVRCRRTLPLQAFGAQFMCLWERDSDMEDCAVCTACCSDPSEDDDEVECVVCREMLPLKCFDAERLTEEAQCNACWAALPPRERKARTKVWKQSLYKCSGCNSELHPHKFNTTELRAWERTSTLHLAKCGNCDADMPINAKCRKCNLCGVKKPLHSFSAAKQRTKDSSKWRCTDCDFPACSSCGIIPMQQKQKPYMCSVCKFPPCSCGARRPQSSKYNISVKPSWQCAACRQ